MNDRIDISLVKSYTFTMFKDFVEFIIFFLLQYLGTKKFISITSPTKGWICGKENFLINLSIFWLLLWPAPIITYISFSNEIAINNFTCKWLFFSTLAALTSFILHLKDSIYKGRKQSYWKDEDVWLCHLTFGDLIEIRCDNTNKKEMVVVVDINAERDVFRVVSMDDMEFTEFEISLKHYSLLQKMIKQHSLELILWGKEERYTY